MKTKISNAIIAFIKRSKWYQEAIEACRFGAFDQGFKAGIEIMRFRPKVGEWKMRKDGLARYRRVSVQREGWTTESEPLGLPCDAFEVSEDEPSFYLEDAICRGRDYHHVDCECSKCSGERDEYGATREEWRQELAAQ